MLLLQALPTSSGGAAIAPARLLLWLVIAADERPGPPARVWLAFVLGAAHRWLINPERNMMAVAGSVGLISILIGVALLIATTAVYFLGRNRLRASSDGFSSMSGQGG